MACQRVNTFALLKQIFKIPTRFQTTFKHLALVGHVSPGLIETSVKEKEDHSVLENAGQDSDMNSEKSSIWGREVHYVLKPLGNIFIS